MDNLKIGQKVSFKKYLKRNGRKPLIQFNCQRYDLKNEPGEGFICGKTVIYTEGYSEWDYDFYKFIKVSHRSVYKVAINLRTIIHVAAEDLTII